MLVAVYKRFFFGLPEEKAFLSTKPAEERDAGTRAIKPSLTLSDWIDSKLEGLRIRHPEKSRVQRLYLNINTITVGGILTLCTVIRVQLLMMRMVLSSVVGETEAKSLSVSFLGWVVSVVPLTHLGGKGQTIVGRQLLLRVSLFLSVGSMVQ